MFHIDLNNAKISECQIQNTDECIYTGLSGFTNHFKTAEDAERELNKLFANQSSWFGFRKNVRSKEKHLKQLELFNQNFPQMSDKSLMKFVNRNRSNFLIAYSTIEDRVHARRRTDGFRNYTAKLLEIYMNSRFYNNLARRIQPSSLGNAVSTVDNDMPKNVLAGTLSATDFGMIAEYDFWTLNNNGNEIPEYMHDKMNSFVERRKTKVDSVLNNSRRQERNYQKKIAKNNHEATYGAMYWGTVWERKIRNDFAIDNPGLTVYEVDGKFRNKNDLWQLGIVDGAVSDREDKLPNSILEIKTSKNGKSWKKGVPQSYRAQALYYLHITGFDKAYVRVLINERDVKDYVLFRNDEIAVGSEKTVQEYINDRVFPFLRSI